MQFMKLVTRQVLLLLLFLFLLQMVPKAQHKTDSLVPVRGFCIDAPRPSGVDSFVQFINRELAPRRVNTLVLLIDYRYRFSSHPELRDSFALSGPDVKKIVHACRKNDIRVIPQINLLGHQSWANRNGKLLREYPQFDETPYIKMPERYVWPNPDNLYCRSYCPLYPGLHDILFPVIDELCDAFETDAFHVGMDEVFYLGEDKCPRCGGMDKAVLYAGEVRAIHDHLQQKGREMWMWGDRLLDGKATGLGMWEASYNNTYRAVDMIPKDVVICDWHYERADKTAVYFAMKGFRVVTCPWRTAEFAVVQLHDMVSFRQQSSAEMRERFMGMLQTVWSRADDFLTGFYTNQKSPRGDDRTSWNCFRVLYDEMGKLD